MRNHVSGTVLALSGVIQSEMVPAIGTSTCFVPAWDAIKKWKTESKGPGLKVVMSTGNLPTLLGGTVNGRLSFKLNAQFSPHHQDALTILSGSVPWLCTWNANSRLMFGFRLRRFSAEISTSGFCRCDDNIPIIKSPIPTTTRVRFITMTTSVKPGFFLAVAMKILTPSFRKSKNNQGDTAYTKPKRPSWRWFWCVEWFGEAVMWQPAFFWFATDFRVIIDEKYFTLKR